MLIQKTVLPTLLLGTLLAAPFVAKADYLVDGNFASGTGWTGNQNVALYCGTSAVNYAGALNAMCFGQASEGTLSQTVSDPAGRGLTLTYWLDTVDKTGYATNDFSVLWNGATVSGSVVTNESTSTPWLESGFTHSGYLEYQVGVNGTGSDSLTFEGANAHGVDILGYASLVDATPVPLPSAAWLTLSGLAGLVLLAAVNCTRTKIANCNLGAP